MKPFVFMITLSLSMAAQAQSLSESYKQLENTDNARAEEQYRQKRRAEEAAKEREFIWKIERVIYDLISMPEFKSKAGEADLNSVEPSAKDPSETLGVLIRRQQVFFKTSKGLICAANVIKTPFSYAMMEYERPEFSLSLICRNPSDAGVVYSIRPYL